jgi:hypothetical protein
MKRFGIGEEQPKDHCPGASTQRGKTDIKKKNKEEATAGIRPETFHLSETYNGEGRWHLIFILFIWFVSVLISMY